MTRFVPTYLDPSSRLGEIIFGLIMVLTFTLAAGFSIPQDKVGVRELLFAAIGCNVAWGIIDAVLYLMNCITLRAGRIRLVRAVQGAPDSQTALTLIQNEIAPEFEGLLQFDDTQALSRSILRNISDARIKSATLTKEDWYGALACFWLVFLSCLPAAVPFLIFSEARFALRVSNFLLVALLFVVGWKWAQYAGTNEWVAGLGMVGIGLALVGTAILLGG